MLKYVGKDFPINNAISKVTGEAEYLNDIRLKNMAFGKLVLSTIPHGKVKNIDISEAKNLPGVISVFTFKDFPEIKYNSALRFKDHNIIKSETVLSEIVRFVGDRIALVVAEEQKIADIAAKLVKVTYEEYDTVYDEEIALKEGTVELHPLEVPGNKICDIRAGVDEEYLEKAYLKADNIFETKIKIPMVSQLPMETHQVIGEYKGGKLTIWATTQNTFAIRVLVSDVYGLPYNKIRVIQPVLGGSFGSKLEAVTELVVAGAALKLKRPIKIVFSRDENMVATRSRNGATIKIKSAFKNDGTMLGMDFNIITNTGAYVSSGANVIGAMSHKVLNTFKGNVRYRGISALTNMPIAGAMRGYGSPQAFFGTQLHLEKVARKLNIDPFDLLMKNVVDVSEVDQSIVGKPEIKACLKRGAELFNYKKRREEIKRQSRGGVLRGIGIGIGAHGNGVFGAHQDCINVTLRLNEDGTFNYWSASHDMGNGSLTSQSIIMAEILDVPINTIEPTLVNTETCPWNLGNYASRGVFVEGGAAKKVAELLCHAILEIAAIAYDRKIEDLDVSKGKVIDTEGKEIATYSEIAMYAQIKLQKEIIITTDYHSTVGRTSFGAHFAEVEVNKLTGEVKVLDYVAVHDVGNIISRLGIEGQLEGGIQMGLGYALREKLTVDEKTGRVNENSLKKYRIFKANEMPKISIDFIETFEEGGPFGAKSISECATAPVAPAILNAVSNALGRDLTIFPVSREEIMNI